MRKSMCQVVSPTTSQMQPPPAYTARAPADLCTHILGTELIFVRKYFFQAMCVVTTLLMHATSKFYTYIKYMHHLRPSG